MHEDLLRRLGLPPKNSAGDLVSLNPSTGEPLGSVRTATREQYDACVTAAQEAFLRWRMVPAPKRGEVVRQIGEALRRQKQDLGLLVTLEAGKIRAEGEGEVQEMIDMCDFAVGLSRQLYGLTMASERPSHRMFEQWHPLGPVGVLTAFNFPVAVYAWNAMVAAVCGDTVVWKPSPHTPLCALAVQQIVERVTKSAGFDGIFQLFITPGAEGGHWLADDRRLPLVSATGSCAMGRDVGPRSRQAVKPDTAGTRREQRHHRDGVSRPAAGPAGRRVRRPRHDGPAVHDAQAAVRARIDRRSASSNSSSPFFAACGSAIRGKRAC